jgi:tetratricopeptide (TPR) repeat protein
VRFVAHSQLGKLKMDLGELDAAEIHLRDAVKIDPTHPVPRTNLALTLMQMGAERSLPEAWEMGRSEVAHVLREHPRHADAFFVLGYWYLERGNDPVRAAEALQQAVRLDVTFAGAAYLQSVALKRAGRTDEAEAALREACRRDPAFTQAWYDLILMLAERGDTEGALREARRALRIGANGRLRPLIEAIEREHKGDRQTD